MAITVSEKEARQKTCPFLERFCEGNDCLAWREQSNGNGICLRVLDVILRLNRRQKVDGEQ